MDYFQAIQNRAAQTAAVVNQYAPELSVGNVTASQLLTLSQELNTLAQQRNDALLAYDAANTEMQHSFTTLRQLVLALPKVIQGELSDAVDAESAMLDMLTPVFAVDPRNSELALKRAMKLISALGAIDAYLAAQTPSRPAIRAGGRGYAELTAMINAFPAVMQRCEDRGADVSAARTALRAGAEHLDRINKRFFSKLKAEARSDTALANALAQIETGARNLPATLSIRDIRQGGAEQRQLLVNYVAVTFDDGAENFIEWRHADGPDGFPNVLPADPSGNALGPFERGARVQLRTRVKNSNGATTGSIRTVEIS